MWTNVTVTPFERPNGVTKATYTEEEARAYERQVVDRNNADRRGTSVNADVATGYNDLWYDRGNLAVPTLQTSLIVDPPDGRIPAFTPDGQRRQAERLAARNAQGPADGPESRSLAERFIVWTTSGPPMLPGPYNNNYQIVQGPGYVAILVEMIHDVRMIPTDGRAHAPSQIRQWMGDAKAAGKATPSLSRRLISARRPLTAARART